MKKIKFIICLLWVTNAFALSSETLFPLNSGKSCGIKCAKAPMNSPTSAENRLVSNRNKAVSATMPGQCLGNALTHQMLVSGAIIKDGPQMSNEEVAQKLEKLKQGEPQEFTGVSSIADISRKYSSVISQFANKMQMKSFYSFKRLGAALKLIGVAKGTNDLDKMAALTQEGKRPAMIFSPPRAPGSTHVVLVDKIEKSGSNYKITYADSNTPNEPQSMTCNSAGLCETPVEGQVKAYALNGAEEKKAFAMASARCCKTGTPSSTNPTQELQREVRQTQHALIPCRKKEERFS